VKSLKNHLASLLRTPRLSLPRHGDRYDRFTPADPLTRLAEIQKRVSKPNPSPPTPNSPATR
jgi:hypothetical protein